MKRCPECNRTFSDETLSFCLVDGAILSAPYDQHATLNIPEPRQTEPPPTEVSKLEETKQEIPPTIASPQPQQKSEELASTIAAPAPAFESSKVEALPAQSAPQSNRLPLIMIIGALLIIALIFFYIGNRANSTNKDAVNINTATANRSNSSTAASNRNQTSNAATPSPLPSLTPVINLGGTVWRVTRYGKYEETFEFKQNGKLTKRQEGDVRQGTWTQQGNKVLINIPESGGYYSIRIEAAIQGEEMSGIFDYLGRQENQSLTARRVK